MVNISKPQKNIYCENVTFSLSSFLQQVKGFFKISKKIPHFSNIQFIFNDND